MQILSDFDLFDLFHLALTLSQYLFLLRSFNSTWLPFTPFFIAFSGLFNYFSQSSHE